MENGNSFLTTINPDGSWNSSTLSDSPGDTRGMAWDCPNQTLYGLTLSQTADEIILHNVNINTGQWTPIGSDTSIISSPLIFPTDMTYSEDHKQLFGNISIEGTHTIDNSTGIWTPLGPTGLTDRFYTGLTYDCKNDVMYGISMSNILDQSFNPQNYVSYLSTIDPNTGQWTEKPNQLGVVIWGLTYDIDNNILYGTGFDSITENGNNPTYKMYTIDTVTGVATEVGLVGGGINDIRGIFYQSTQCCTPKRNTNQCCREEIPVPPLSSCVRPYISPIGECSRFKSGTGAGLASRSSPVPSACCIDKMRNQYEKDQLVRNGYWNHYSGLRPNSPLSNRLERLKNRNFLRR